MRCKVSSYKCVLVKARGWTDLNMCIFLMPKFVYNVGIQSVPSFRLATGLKHHNSQIKRLEEFYIRLFFQLYTKDKISWTKSCHFFGDSRRYSCWKDVCFLSKWRINPCTICHKGQYVSRAWNLKSLSLYELSTFDISKLKRIDSPHNMTEIEVAYTRFHRRPSQAEGNFYIS